jgi:RHS repeat-associated protein
MPMSVKYATVNGRMVQENRGGTVTKYVPDTLGSVIQTQDATGVQTSTTHYWPFGEERTSTGTNPSSWGFVGTYGYLTDAPNRQYVRARYLRNDLSRWLNVDPLWPYEPTYAYTSRPTTRVDVSGLQVIDSIIDMGHMGGPIMPPSLYNYQESTTTKCYVRVCFEFGADYFGIGKDNYSHSFACARTTNGECLTSFMPGNPASYESVGTRTCYTNSSELRNCYTLSTNCESASDFCICSTTTSLLNPIYGGPGGSLGKPINLCHDAVATTLHCWLKRRTKRFGVNGLLQAGKSATQPKKPIDWTFSHP